jgi:hypothetical protein
MFTSRIPTIAAVLALFVLATACKAAGGGSASATASPTVSTATSASAARSASGSASASASADASGVQTSAFDLELGDCFSTGDISTVTEVTVVDCAAPHVYEVFGLTEYQAAATDSFPGDDALNSAADDACRPAFDDYVGIAYDDSDWYGTFINPSESTWADGDREIVCVLHTQDETSVTGSAKDSAR